MKKITSLFFPAFILAVLIFAACAAPPKMAAPPVMESIEAPRYAHIEELFENIVYAEDESSAAMSEMELLEKCESPDSEIRIYKYLDNRRMPMMTLTVREYISYLNEIDTLVDNIDQVSYNEQGKITGMIILRD